VTDPDRPLALVTGGGRGYGACVVRALAAQGAVVGVLGRDAGAVGAIADEVSGVAVVADVLDVQAVRRGIDALVERCGPVEILVNNAGVAGTFGRAWEIDGDDWWRTVEVNLRGSHNVTSAVLAAMCDRGRGRIINVVSNAGVNRWPLGSSYAVSKAALIKYGENVAAEVRRFGVVVLNFNPGILEIGLTETLFAAEPQPGTHDAMIAAWLREQLAAGRGIAAEVSAAQLARLASGAADALTGRYITAYDDIDALVARADEIVDANHYTLGLLGE
jgi:NADP-dependent 3-hydroxy acid dehydrogenase YdfG